MNNYFRITLDGYGGESSYIKLDKETFDYWSKRRKIATSNDPLLDYVVEDNRKDIPYRCDFLFDSKKQEKIAWQDYPSIHYHHGLIASSGTFTVTQVDGSVYDSEFINDHNITNTIFPEEQESNYMMQVYNHEKGKFFEHIISTNDFDLSRLTINTIRYFNGDDIVVSVMYDNEILSNDTQDISFIGTSVSIWKSR